MLRALMLPLARRFDPSAVDNLLSGFCTLSGFVPVLLSEPVAEDGFGTAAVDGTALSGCQQVRLYGFWLLLVPVGEVAFEYDRRYAVTLCGFRSAKGRPFARCRFALRTEKKRVADGRYAEHDALALEAARSGMVLLKNEAGALPLGAEGVLNVFGPGQHTWRHGATGASAINPRWRPTLVEAVAEHSGFQLNGELSAFYRRADRFVPPEDMMRRARARSDAALVVISRHSGELQDNRPVPGQYALCEGERAMLEAVAARFERTVVVLNTGYPIEMTWLRQIPVKAVVYAGFAGMLSAWALMELLDGRANFSGHLADSWPWRYDDHPVSHNFPVLGAKDALLTEKARGVRIYYEEDLYVGYRYYDTFGVPTAFCFGHGLSYTRFDARSMGIERVKDGGVSVRAEVVNVGAAAGRAVLQLYAQVPTGAVEQPARKLVAFEKTGTLAPGERCDVTMKAALSDLAAYDEVAHAWVLPEGEIALWLGQSLEDAERVGALRVPRRHVVRQVTQHGAPVEPLERLSRAHPTVAGGRSGLTPLAERIAVPAARTAWEPAPLPKYRGPGLRWADVRRDPARLDDFVSQLSGWTLCRLNACGGHRWAPWKDGAAGFTPKIRRWGLPMWSVSDANAGLNLKKPNLGLPASSVVAASFDRELARAVGRAIAEESREHGICLNLGPGMNLHRGVLCGRHPEYFSEDPFLTGTMAGWHGRGLVESGVGCCYKHLFANNSELCRKASHSVVSEQALRELYFKSFEVAFRVQKPTAVMTSYNALNGLYPAENADILQGLLRGEWGFEGWIMSDWGACATIDSVEMARAGNGWITPGGLGQALRLYCAYLKGRLPRAVLQRNVKAMLGAMAGIESAEKRE